jgi:hypothetical protein
MLAMLGGPPDQARIAARKETTMTQPQETDQCASIRQDIKDTQLVLNRDRFDLSHAEVLTTQKEEDIKKEIPKLEKKLDGLHNKLRRCLEENSHGAVPQTVRSEAGWAG